MPVITTVGVGMQYDWFNAHQLLFAGLDRGIPLAAVTAAISLPGFFVKQIINCFQLRSSMQALVAYDQQREAAKRE